MDIKKNLDTIKQTIPTDVKLVAVSKFHAAPSVMEAYDAGQRVFGESRVQELNQKQATLPNDIEWHLIGHLQTNKIKSIVPYIHTIQSIDSWKLLTEVNKYAEKTDRVIKCLLEIHIADEEGKYGFSFDSCTELLQTEDWKSLKHIQIAGLMGMATYTDNCEQIRYEFRDLKNFFDKLKASFFATDTEFKELSMGMSNDYTIAIEEGATIVRVGSSIFGEREY